MRIGEDVCFMRWVFQEATHFVPTVVDTVEGSLGTSAACKGGYLQCEKQLLFFMEPFSLGLEVTWNPKYCYCNTI